MCSVKQALERAAQGTLTPATCPDRGCVQELSGHGEQAGSMARFTAASERNFGFSIGCT